MQVAHMRILPSNDFQSMLNCPIEQFHIMCCTQSHIIDSSIDCGLYLSQQQLISPLNFPLTIVVLPCRNTVLWQFVSLFSFCFLPGYHCIRIPDSGYHDYPTLRYAFPTPNMLFPPAICWSHLWYTDPTCQMLTLIPDSWFMISLWSHPRYAFPTRDMPFPPVICWSHLWYADPYYDMLIPPTICFSHLRYADPTYDMLIPPAKCWPLPPTMQEATGHYKVSAPPAHLPPPHPHLCRPLQHHQVLWEQGSTILVSTLFSLC